MARRGSTTITLATLLALAGPSCRAANLPPELGDFYFAEGIYDFPAAGLNRIAVEATVFTQLDVLPPTRRGGARTFSARFDFIEGDIACSFGATYVGDDIFAGDTVPIAAADCLVFPLAGPAISVAGISRVQVDPGDHLEICVMGTGTSPTAVGDITILMGADPE